MVKQDEDFLPQEYLPMQEQAEIFLISAFDLSACSHAQACIEPAENGHSWMGTNEKLKNDETDP